MREGKSCGELVNSEICLYLAIHGISVSLSCCTKWLYVAKNGKENIFVTLVLIFNEMLFPSKLIWAVHTVENISSYKSSTNNLD